MTATMSDDQRAVLKRHGITAPMARFLLAVSDGKQVGAKQRLTGLALERRGLLTWPPMRLTDAGREVAEDLDGAWF